MKAQLLFTLFVATTISVVNCQFLADLLALGAADRFLFNGNLFGSGGGGGFGVFGGGRPQTEQAFLVVPDNGFGGQGFGGRFGQPFFIPN